MAVYNITKLNKSLAKSIAKYYGVSKVQLRYSDWFNQFGAYVKDEAEGASVPAIKRKVVSKYLMKVFGFTLIPDLKRCPVIIRKTQYERSRR